MTLTKSTHLLEQSISNTLLAVPKVISDLHSSFLMEHMIRTHSKAIKLDG